MNRLSRVVWFLVIASALLIVIMMFTVKGTPNWIRNTPFLGTWLAQRTGTEAER
jgi:hypothetical protein